MTQPAGRTVLITGANAGLGKETARQLGLRQDTARIYLACRNLQRATAAQTELETSIGKAVFEVVVMDVSDLGSVRSAVSALDAPIDAVIMNAGGNGGATPMALTIDGVTTMFATNMLGHVVLLEQLINERKLTDVALLVGSEAARGVPKFRMQRPSFPTSSADEFAAVIDGSTFGKAKPKMALAYGQTKYLGALWMAALARKHPDLRFITMSPGNTPGTDGAKGMPLPQRILVQHVMARIGPRLGIAHPLETGAQRLVDGISDPALRSGVFYASAANTLTGPVVNQADIFADLANPAYQDNADEAIHRFIA
ncbi:MAG: SDR family NAD(P)-dependent oxidoreductase [Pseudomonadota bacterium]|nr:SDR family NAD(P)-dependent oxidoreductase [Pseudomonadota bacterium]